MENRKKKLKRYFGNYLKIIYKTMLMNSLLDMETF